MGTYYVYILRSRKDNKLYIGQTISIEDRLKKHNNGQVLSTKGRAPFDLIYSEQYTTRSAAMQREWHLKSTSGIKEKKSILNRLGL